MYNCLPLCAINTTTVSVVLVIWDYILANLKLRTIVNNPRCALVVSVKHYTLLLLALIAIIDSDATHDRFDKQLHLDQGLVLVSALPLKSTKQTKQSQGGVQK